MVASHLACQHYNAVFGQAGVESPHIIPLWDGVTVGVSVAEEDFEGAGRRHKDELGRMKDEKSDTAITACRLCLF
ncbi:MAG: hypothetical protein Fur002_20290 [Anaerolineales bacterium]